MPELDYLPPVKRDAVDTWFRFPPATNIDTIEVVRRGRVRRSKLYYLRTRRGKSARIVEQTNYRETKDQGEA